jgi:type I restriction enzyme, S subunit
MSARAAPSAIPQRFKLYSEYKESGIKWLGKTPQHWTVRRLGSTITSCQNGVWGEEPDGFRDVVCVRVADFNRVTLKVELDEPTLRSIEQRVLAARGLRSGDLLLEKSGGGENQPVGAVVLFDHASPAVCSNFVARMTIAPGHHPRYQTYLHSALYAQRINTRHIKQNTGIQNFDSASYLSEVVALPPQSEQRAIAAFLDRETSRIDELVAKKERLIDLLQEKRAALITRAVTMGLDPNVPMKDSGIEWLGEIPTHWNVLKTKFIAANTPGSFTDGDWIESPFITSSGVRLIQCGNIGTGIFEEQGFRYITPDTFEAFKCSEVVPGDVLICRLRSSPTILAARACLAPQLGTQMITSVDNCILRPSREHDARYLVYQMSLPRYLSYVEEIARGGTRDRISRSMLADFRFATPPHDEQVIIADFLDGETARIEAVVSTVRRVMDHLKELRTALISAAVMGKIDVREEAA